MAVSTEKDDVARLAGELRALSVRTPHDWLRPTLTAAADTLIKLEMERSMLAYEKGGHSLWRRYAGDA